MSDIRLSSSVSDQRTIGLKLIILLGALSAFAPFGTDMYLSAMPAMTQSLKATMSQVQWTLGAFFAGMCLGQLIYGPLIDSFGRRRPLMLGVAVFTLASFAIAAVSQVEFIVGLRLLQAMGGCAGMVVARAIIQDRCEPVQAARVLTSMMLVQGIAPVLAPVLGGYVLLLGDWRLVFAVLGCMGTCSLLVAWRILPETLPDHRRQPLRLRESLITYGRLLKRKPFIVSTLTSACAMGSLFAYISESPFVFMDLHGVGQQAYGWLFALNAGGMMVAGRINYVLLRRKSPQTLMRLGAAVMAVSAAVLLALHGSASLTPLMVPLFFCIASGPMVMANSTALAMAAGRDEAGSASSLLGTLQFAVAALAAAGVSAAHNGSAAVMPAVMLAFAVMTLALAWFPFATSPAQSGGDH